MTHLLNSLAGDLRFEVYSLTLEVFKRSLAADMARVPELHDRLIAATALSLHELGRDVKLITRDQSLTEAKLLPVVW